MGLLPAVRDLAQETLSRAREQYHAADSRTYLMPKEARIDPSVLTHLVASVPTGRLARLLVDARPMGP